MEFGLMYENNNGENCVFNKDRQSLRLATTSSSVVPGADLKRLVANHRRTDFAIFGGRTRTCATRAEGARTFGRRVRGHTPSENFEK